jgi:hypothetical protein
MSIQSKYSYVHVTSNLHILTEYLCFGGNPSSGPQCIFAHSLSSVSNDSVRRI